MPKIVAELGCNHGGDIETAKKMISFAAHYCGVDVVKFQKRTIGLMSEGALNRPYTGNNSFGKTYGEHRQALEFSINQHIELKKFCEDNGVEYSCSVWDVTAAEQIISLKPSYIKVPSAANLDFEILKCLRDNFKGMIHISMGMTTLEEKSEILNFTGNSIQFIPYHCTSVYPLNVKDTFLRDLEFYRNRISYGMIGYSGHHKGIAIDIAAMALGASWIERHFTLDRTSKGTDHAASLEPDGMRRLVRDAKCFKDAFITSDLGLKKCEIPARKKLRG